MSRRVSPKSAGQSAGQSAGDAPGGLAQAVADLRAFLALAKPYRAWLWGGAALSALTIIAGLALLGWAGGLIATAALSAGGLGAATLVRGRGLSGAAVVRTGARYAERVATHEATFRILADIRLWVFARATPLSPGRLDLLRGGDVLARLTGDVDALDGLYLRVATPLIAATAGLAAAMLVIAAASPPAALVAGVLFLAASAGAPALTLRLAAGPGRDAADALSAVRAEATDLVEGLAELKAFGAEDRALAALDDAAERALTAQRRMRAAGGLSTAVLAGAGPLTALAAALTASATGAGLTACAIAAFVTLALFEAAPPLAQAAEEAGRVARSARRLRALEALAPTAADPARPSGGPGAAGLARGSATTPHVAFEGVRLFYPDAARPALDGVSFTVPPGGRLALSGPSGAGKSSVFHVLLRFYDPCAGTVRLAGTDVTRRPQATTRAEIAYVGQHAGLISASLRDNLALAAPEADEAALLDAVARADLTTLLDSLPDGLDTWIGEDGQLLSGGQARRVALARAILRDAPILLLDEPTEGLDADTEARVIAALTAYVTDARRTVILASHRPALMDLAEEVVTLEAGRRAPEPAAAAGD